MSERRTLQMRGEVIEEYSRDFPAEIVEIYSRPLPGAVEPVPTANTQTSEEKAPGVEGAVDSSGRSGGNRFAGGGGAVADMGIANA